MALRAITVSMLKAFRFAVSQRTYKSVKKDSIHFIIFDCAAEFSCGYNGSLNMLSATRTVLLRCPFALVNFRLNFVLCSGK